MKSDFKLYQYRDDPTVICQLKKKTSTHYFDDIELCDYFIRNFVEPCRDFLLTDYPPLMSYFVYLRKCKRDGLRAEMIIPLLQFVMKANEIYGIICYDIIDIIYAELGFDFIFRIALDYELGNVIFDYPCKLGDDPIIGKFVYENTYDDFIAERAQTCIKGHDNNSPMLLLVTNNRAKKYPKPPTADNYLLHLMLTDKILPRVNLSTYEFVDLRNYYSSHYVKITIMACYDVLRLLSIPDHIKKRLRSEIPEYLVMYELSAELINILMHIPDIGYHIDYVDFVHITVAFKGKISDKALRWLFFGNKKKSAKYMQLIKDTYDEFAK